MLNGVFNLIFVLLLFAPFLNARPKIPGYNLLDDLPSESHRTRRYVLYKSWNRKILTWTLHKDNLAPADEFIVRNTIHRAFNEWASVSSLRFVEFPVENKLQADINISFLKAVHGDRLPFDGPQGVVAHATFPSVGTLHFDADENWTLSGPDGKDGINLYQVAVHEIGHVLGLGHSSDPRSIMYPQSKKIGRHVLADDDVRGIRRLYPQST